MIPDGCFSSKNQKTTSFFQARRPSKILFMKEKTSLFFSHPPVLRFPTTKITIIAFLVFQINMYQHCGECQNCLYSDLKGYNNFQIATNHCLCEKVKIIIEEIYPKEKPSKLQKLYEIMSNYDYISTQHSKKVKTKIPPPEEIYEQEDILGYCIVCSGISDVSCTGDNGCRCYK